MKLEILWKKKELSNRAYNVCRKNKLHSLDEIINYYKVHKSFKRLNHCGKTTEHELIKFIIDKKDCNESNSLEKKEETKKLESLSRIQKQICNLFLNIAITSLSHRSRNALILYLKEGPNGNFNISNFIRKIILNKSFRVDSINNVGKLSKPEIHDLITKTERFLSEIVVTEDKAELYFIRNKYLLQKIFGLEDVPEELLRFDSSLKLVEYLIKNNIIFRHEVQSNILNLGMGVFQDENLVGLEKIAKRSNFTPERVRQLKVKLFEELFEKFEFIKHFNLDIFEEYGIVEDNIFLNIEAHLSDINKKNQTNFSINFLTLLFYCKYHDKYSLVGDIEDVFIPKQFKSRKNYQWNQLYLIEKEFESCLEYGEILMDLSSRLDQRIDETYKFNIKSYLLRFNENLKIEKLNRILPFIEYLLFSEINMFLDTNDNIVFPRNSKKQMHEYCYEALENLGKPSKISAIVSYLKNEYPEISYGKDSLRSSMIRNKLFVPIGRKSVYALKKWEIEKKNFKGGTIRDIVKEFLERSQKPNHLSEITKEVLKFRPKSNGKSILTNLKLDESRTFEFFQNSYIGLKKYNYGKEFIKPKREEYQRKSWEESYNILLEFFKKENRLPFSTDKVSADEPAMYRWLNIQRRKLKTNKLSSTQKRLIRNIYKSDSLISSARDYEDKINYTLLLDFLNEKNRTPSSSKSEEESLYRFYYKIRKEDMDNIKSSELKNLHKKVLQKTIKDEYQKREG